MKTRLFVGIAAGIICGAGAANAVVLTGEVSINGSDSYTATQVNFSNPANIGGDSGSFTVLGTCTGCVTMATTLTASTSGQLFTGSNLGHTVTLDVTPPNAFTFVPGATPTQDILDVTGAGMLSLDGTTVSGTYSLSTQGPVSTPGETIDVTFSATASPVSTPEPSSIALLGAGLLGLGLGRRVFRRRRNPPVAPDLGQWGVA